jgi:hypothetical protein
MIVPLEEAIISALRSTSGRDALREALVPIINEVVAQVRDAAVETPQPLRDILGVKPDSARKIEARDAKRGGTLKQLAVGMRGRSRLYLRSQVHAYMSQPKGKRIDLKVVG